MSDIQRATTLHDYLQVARRRWWIVLAVVVTTGLSAAYFTSRQEKLYEASAQVLVQSFDTSDSDRALRTQADLAAVSSEVEERVKRQLGLDTLPEIEVTPKTDSDILVFSSTARSPELAAEVATAYANEYKNFQRDLVTADVDQALEEVEAQIEELQGVRRGRRDLTLYGNLLAKRDQLQTIRTLETSRALLVREASPGAQVQPKPVRNTLFGLALGLVIGLGLAFLREALDTLVRSSDEIADHLGVPLLARVPPPPRRLRRADRLTMISEPESPGAEAFRVLRANVDFARIETDARVLLVTSAVDGEGKSTTAANLAVALARAGQRVALVDLDLRRPILHRFFEVDGPGVTQLAVGSATLEEALAPIPIVWPGGRSPWRESGEFAQVGGMLHVLPAGDIPRNVDDVLTHHAVANVLENLRTSADVVLVDSTPLLVGDAMALTSVVDAVLVVTRLGVVRGPMLRELRRILDAIPAQTIGFAVTGVGSTPGYLGPAGLSPHSRARAQEPVT